MGLYKCTVYDSNKKRKNIKINLESKEDINVYASNNGLNIVNIKEKSSGRKYKKIKDKEISVLCKKIGILIESGCEVTKLLSILKKQSDKKNSNLLSNISNHIQNGNSITDAFQNTKIFSNFFLSMVKAGEVSGNLDIVMNNLSDYYDKEYKLKSKITNILIYPTILIILTILSSLFILIVIIPSFENIFINNGINPPILTKILINISNFLRKNILYVGVGIITFVITLYYFIKKSINLKYKINKLKLKVPFIKNINQIVITSRFSRALCILISSGVQVVDAIDISSKVIDNEFVYERLIVSNEYIKKGNSIGDSLHLSNIFPKLFLSMIAIGEEGGKLDTSLMTISNFYENELDTNIQQLMKFIEPIIIVIIGIIVGSFIISMVMPMFDVVNAI